MFRQGRVVFFDEKVTLDLMKKFAETFDDFAYLHYNDDFARKVGFERRVIQAALMSCLITKCIVRTFGDSTVIRSQSISFIKPIYPNQQFTIQLKIISNIKNQAIKLKIAVIVENNIHYRGIIRIKVSEDIRDSYFKDKNYTIDDLSEYYDDVQLQA